MKRFKNFLIEASGTDFSIWIETPDDIDKWYDSFSTKPAYSKSELKKLMKFLNKEKLGLTPIFAGERTTPKFKIRAEVESYDIIKNWIKENLSDKFKFGMSAQTAKTVFLFGKGNPKKGTPNPTGADWESLITDKYNELVGDTDPDASSLAQKFYPEYGEAASKIAKSFSKELRMKTKMVQYGATGGRKNLSSNWLKYGGTNGTPKTDMYTKNYNISLKKAGGSQLASGGKGETIATFYAALEYLGEDRKSKKDIDKIMSMIEKNFTKIKNRQLTAGAIKKIITGKKKVELTPKLKSDLETFSTTDAFHKELNEEITKNLNFEKNPSFLKWYCFEAMSGYKKFANKTSIASICIEFDAKTGAISKAIPVTADGKASGLSGIPTVSKQVESISSKMKIFAAWKTGDGSPNSALRVLPQIKEQEVNSLRDIILNELYNDKVANKVMIDLHEEVLEGDEFFLIENIFNKIKQFSSKAKNWLNNIYKKIIIKVKEALNKIKQMGAEVFEKLFEFFNIEISVVKEKFPKDLHGFVYGKIE